MPGHEHAGDRLIDRAGLYDLAMRVSGWTLGRWRRGMVDTLGLQPGDVVLDVASGTGQLALELASRVGSAGSVDGVDASGAMVARATRTAGRSTAPTRFQVARAQQLPFPDASFDVVTCTAAMHHIDPDTRGEAIAEMYRVLRPGGRLLVADAQTPPPGRRHVLTRLILGHAVAGRPLGQAADLMRAVGFTDVTRSTTRIPIVGQVVATKP